MEAWENTHVQIPDAPPNEVLRFLLEQNHLKQKDLADIVAPSQVSNILKGTCSISKRLANALGQRFNVNPSVFL